MIWGAEEGEGTDEEALEMQMGMRDSWMVPEGEEAEGYESLCGSEFEDGDGALGGAHNESVGGYEGLEGIYRFLRECDDARR